MATGRAIRGGSVHLATTQRSGEPRAPPARVPRPPFPGAPRAVCALPWHLMRPVKRGRLRGRRPATLPPSGARTVASRTPLLSRKPRSRAGSRRWTDAPQPQRVRLRHSGRIGSGFPRKRMGSKATAGIACMPAGGGGTAGGIRSGHHGHAMVTTASAVSHPRGAGSGAPRGRGHRSARRLTPR